jgi:hypothetical protein
VKKLLIALGAFTTALVGSAKADVSVSGSGQVNLVSASGDATGVTADKTYMEQTGTLSFAMSTETDNGMSVSSSMKFEYGDDKAAVPTGDVMGALSLGMDGMTVTLGEASSLGAFGAGDVTAGFATAHQVGVFDGVTAGAASMAGEISTATGQGITVSTALTDTMTLDLSYVMNSGDDNTSFDASYAAGVVKDIASGNISTTVGGASVTVGMASGSNPTVGENNFSSIGGSVSYVMGDVTLSGAASNQSNGANDKGSNAGVSLAYALDGSTTVSVGGQSASVVPASGEKDKASSVSANVTRTLGGGVSIFADYYSTKQDNNGTTGKAQAVSVGTSVSF